MKGDLAGALDDLNQAIEIDPKHAPAFGNRGLLRQTQGDLPGALADWRKALEVAPSDWPSRRTVEGWIREAGG